MLVLVVYRGTLLSYVPYQVPPDPTYLPLQYEYEYPYIARLQLHSAHLHYVGTLRYEYCRYL